MARESLCVDGREKRVEADRKRLANRLRISVLKKPFDPFKRREAQPIAVAGDE